MKESKLIEMRNKVESLGAALNKYFGSDKEILKG